MSITTRPADPAIVPPSGAERDRLGAFVPGDATRLSGRPGGPLNGLTFAAKDLFDVAGTVTGCGTPDWASGRSPAARSAWAVRTLLDAGADLAGKVVTDEISLGLLGVNRHQGTPLNPRAPDRVPGGSSSGSASAVAGGLVDVALGSDSGGSVRVPSSFCGLYGLRPTHGRIPVEGLMTQAPSFDTVGFFARDAETFARVGEVLLREPAADPAPPDDVLLATDCFALADPEVRTALAPVLAAVRAAGVRVTEVRLADGDLPEWARPARLLQSHEFDRTFAPWIDAANPRLSFEVASALAGAALIRDADVVAPERFRADVRRRFDDLLDGRRVLALPTTAILPIRRDARLSAMRTAVDRLVELTCVAGLAGLPQVSLPLGRAGTVPVGLSLIGWRGSDARLIGMARALERLGAPLTSAG